MTTSGELLMKMTDIENSTLTRIALVTSLALCFVTFMSLFFTLMRGDKQPEVVKEVVTQVVTVEKQEPLITEALPYTEEDLHCMALNLYHEARNELDAGLYAVADVTQNRVDDKRWPNSICAVVYEAKTYTGKDGKKYPKKNRCQFSWYCDGRSDEPRPGRSWEKCQYIARMFLTHDEFRGITEGATHYHATYVNPRWATAKGMHMIGQIGEHIFYRWK